LLLNFAFNYSTRSFLKHTGANHSGNTNKHWQAMFRNTIKSCIFSSERTRNF